MEFYYSDSEVTVTSFVSSHFRLDGGSMFGSVPKTIWSKKISCDDLNRIPLVTRNLLIEHNNYTAVVDTSTGYGWNNKFLSIYCIEPGQSPPVPYSSISDVLITHLHFDHAGGLFRKNGEEITASFPSARHHVSRSNYGVCLQPNNKEQASYTGEVREVLSKVVLFYTEDHSEVLPFIYCHFTSGHTEGLQWIEIRLKDKNILFPSDIIPTSHHLHQAYHMGYDCNALLLLDEKAAILDYAKKNKSVIIFQHDPDIAFLESDTRQ